MGHLHLDHAGGLEHFIDTPIPIYVHEEEFKHACWAVATGADLGVYLGHYMSLERLNWNTFVGSQIDLFQGLTLHHAPGHSLGLCMLQINLEKDGTFLWKSDQFHVRENYEQGYPQGGLMRNSSGWVRSLQVVRRLERLFGAGIVFGHDREAAMGFMGEKRVWE